MSIFHEDDLISKAFLTKEPIPLIPKGPTHRENKAYLIEAPDEPILFMDNQIWYVCWQNFTNGLYFFDTFNNKQDRDDFVSVVKALSGSGDSDFTWTDVQANWRKYKAIWKAASVTQPSAVPPEDPQEVLQNETL